MNYTLTNNDRIFMQRHGDAIWIIERAPRKGSRKLTASVMPAYRAEPDKAVARRQVPLAVRRAARHQLIG